MQTELQGFRLSPQQEDLWQLQQQNADRPYLAQCAISISGSLDIPTLKAALELVVSRHEILRTTFKCLPGMTIPLQVITDRPFTWNYNNELSPNAAQDRTTEWEALLQPEHALVSASTDRSPLVCSLVAHAADRFVLSVSTLALCADAATLKNLVYEIGQSYEACLQGRSIQDEPLQYADLAQWQHQLIEEAEPAQKNWDLKTLSELARSLKLPGEQPSTDAAAFDPQTYAISLKPELAAQIAAFAQQREISMETVFLAVWQTAIWRLTEQSEIVVNTACDGRKYEELASALGLLTKYIPIRSHVDAELSFDRLVEQVETSVREACDRQEFWSRNASRDGDSNAEPLFGFPFGFKFEDWSAKYAAGGVSFSIEQMFTYIDRFKVRLSCVRRQDEWMVVFHYDANAFLTADIQRLAEQFQTLTTHAIAQPQTPLDRLELLSERERQRLLFDFNNTQTDLPSALGIHHLFEDRVEQTPDRVALLFDGEPLTYAQLNTRANQLAHALQRLGVGPEVRVGICLERSAEMVVAILAVLKAGGAYVPLDPAYPQTRLTFMVENTKISVLLTQERLRSIVPKPIGSVVFLDTVWSSVAQNSPKNLPVRTEPSHLAYIIFTSGTTGKPKGVMVTHGNLCNYVQALSQRLGITAEDVYLHTASIAFSSSVRQLLVPLCQGATVAITTAEQKANPLLVLEALQQYGVTVMDIVPSYWRICQQALLSLNPTSRQALLSNQLRLILSASEPLTSDLPQQWWFEFEHPARLVNMYGQTETTGIVCVYDIPHQQSDRVHIVPLGSPLPNSQIYVLDRYAQPVPIGVLGEIHVGGAGLARGYFDRPELTAEKFIPNPFIDRPSARIYKTGDVGRYLPDGTIEIVGRSDDQVKLRGMRIELGEIASVLSQHEAVRQSIVLARSDERGEKSLVAYIVPQLGKTLVSSELRRFVAAQLPDYMVPSVFVLLDKVPLTPNGKIDRLALPAPDSDLRDAKEPLVAARNAVEQQLLEIWAEVLGKTSIGVMDNFFELGGHSLLAVRLLAQIEGAFDRRLSVATLYQAPTIAQLAQMLQSQPSQALSPAVVQIQPGRPSPTQPILFCVHVLGRGLSYYRPLAKYLGSEQPMYGLSAQIDDSIQAPRDRVDALATYYIEQMRQLQPHGPYFLTGVSFGGLVAFEMAQQLMAQGEEVGMLALLDTYGPDAVKRLPTEHVVSSHLDRFSARSLAHAWTVLQAKIVGLKNQLVKNYQIAACKVYMRMGWTLPFELQSFFFRQQNKKAMRGYTPTSYPGQIVLMKAMEFEWGGIGSYQDPTLGWGPLAKGGLEVRDVPGDHLGMLQDPHVSVLAGHLQDCIQRVVTKQRSMQLSRR